MFSQALASASYARDLLYYVICICRYLLLYYGHTDRDNGRELFEIVFSIL